MFMLPNFIYRFNAISIKIQWHIFPTGMKVKKNLKTEKHKRTQIIQEILKKNKAGGITVPDYRLYYKAIFVKTVCC